jgi:alkaline phosphatase D
MTGEMLACWSRRGAIGLLAACVSAPVLARTSRLSRNPFQLGVASGEPAADGFVIWTRLNTEPADPQGGMPPARFTVAWEIGTDPRFSEVVQTGEATAYPESGHSIHVELTDLLPSRPYWYRFVVDGHQSPVGRARTTAPAGQPLAKVRFASVGCQHYEQGYFTAYRHLAHEPDIDFVFHSGDYIYETVRNEQVRNPRGGFVDVVRLHNNDMPFSLDSYRLRYAQYRSDPDLQAAHAAHSWFVSYDDHEVSNNWASDKDQYGTPPDVFLLRRAAAFQAFFEFMPLRPSVFRDPSDLKMYRRQNFGDLLQAHFLDTRQYRTDQPCGDKVKPQCAGIEDRDASMLGAAQEAWLLGGLRRSPTKWNMIAQQVMMMDLDRRTDDGGSLPLLNMDAWTGYRAARQRLLGSVGRATTGNLIVLTGDEHQNYAGDIRLGGGGSDTPIVAHEFVGTSITTGGNGSKLRPGAEAILKRNPDCHMINDQRGYMLCTATNDAWQTEFKVLDYVDQPGSDISILARYQVDADSAGIRAL